MRLPLSSAVALLRAARPPRDEAWLRDERLVEPDGAVDWVAVVERVKPGALRSVLYFIAEEELGPVKVGHTSRDVATRLSGLQTGNPRALTLVGAVPGPKSLEAWAHRHLKAHRVRGEWFARQPALDLLSRLLSENPRNRR